MFTRGSKVLYTLHPLRLMIALATLVSLFALAPTQRADAAFPGANGKIAFSRYPRTSAPFEEIYVVNADGSGLTRLTNRGGLERSSVAPVWAPDGTKFVFERYTSGSPFTSELVIMGSDGTELTSFVAPPETNDSRPTWSPDGTKLLFVRNEDLFVRDLTTASVTRVTNTTAPEFEASWSPDGTRIAFTRFNASSATKVHVANIDPTTFALTGVTQVTPFGVEDSNPKWHPTQNKLVVSRVRPSWNPSEVVILNLNTGNERRMTNNSIYDFTPAYSPDGRFIVWSRGPEDADTELIKKNIRTGATTVVTSNAVFDQQPDWQPLP